MPGFSASWLRAFSIRATSRVANVNVNTVLKLLVDAGTACLAHHDEHVRGVRAKRVQADEIWSFTYCKERTVEYARRPTGPRPAARGPGPRLTLTPSC